MSLADARDDLVQDDDFAVASQDRYLLLVWRKRITVAGALAARHALTRLHARLPSSPLAFVTLIEEGCSLSVPEEVRDLISTMLREHNHALAATAVAYERAGFLAAVVRSVITAINLASAAAFRSQVCDKLVDAIRFVTYALGDSAHERVLVDIMNTMRAPARSEPGPTGRLTQRLRALVR